jgi:hypothetical protein
VGVGGNKEKGLAMLRQSAAHGVVTSVESRTVLSLFLRHDARYAEALVVQHELAEQYPHNYLFRLEEANLTKDKGNGAGAIALYELVLGDAARPGYFVDSRLQMAWFVQRLAAQAGPVECGRDVRPAARAGEGGAVLQAGIVGWGRPVAGG